MAANRSSVDIVALDALGIIEDLTSFDAGESTVGLVVKEDGSRLPVEGVPVGDGGAREGMRGEVLWGKAFLLEICTSELGSPKRSVEKKYNTCKKS